MRKTFQSESVYARLGGHLTATARNTVSASRLRAVALLLWAATLSVTSTHASAVSYAFIDLGTLGGGSSAAAGINNAGQVVGYSSVPGASHATLWNGTTPTDLGTLGGQGSQASSINDAGQVVGVSRPTGNVVFRATLWNGTTATDLGTLGGTGNSVAHGINNSGQVVGVSDTDAPIGSGFSHATLWTGTTPIDLGTLGGLYSVAYAINDAGQAVGISTIIGSDEPLHATLWTGTTPTDLGTLGGTYSIAYGINNAGHVVGYSTITGDTAFHATLWNDSTPTDLGTLGVTDSFAYDINNAGQVVGSSGTIGGGTANRATLWNGTVVTDLNSFLDAATLAAGWHLYEARGINDRGWIAGTAYNSFTGETHAYLLAAIPEPEIYALMLAGLGALAFATRRNGPQVRCSTRRSAGVHFADALTGSSGSVPPVEAAGERSVARCWP